MQGVEHVAGVYAGNRLVRSLTPEPSSGRWPNKDCDTWCDRAHRVDLASFTSTAKVAKIDGKMAVGTASGQDLGKSAYFLVTKGGGVTCIQRTFAHREHFHLLLTQFECTSRADPHTDAPTAAVTVELTEPGPSMIPLRDNKGKSSSNLSWLAT